MKMLHCTLQYKYNNFQSKNNSIYTNNCTIQHKIQLFYNF